MKSKAMLGARGREAPPAIRAIFAAWVFSAIVVFLVITVYAAGDHRRIEVAAEAAHK